MRIALINENSQAAKNEMVYNTLKKVAESKGHTVDNYGMYAADDAAQLTYVQNGILAALLINSGAADFVVTGCGTGEGAMLALNSFPGVLCGHVVDPSDAYMFMQINDASACFLSEKSSCGISRISISLPAEVVIETAVGTMPIKAFNVLVRLPDSDKKSVIVPYVIAPVNTR